MKRLIVVGALALMSCTPKEHAAWLEWHAVDPVATEAYAEEWKANHAAQPTEQTGLRNRQGDGVWNKIARCESGGRWDYPPITNSSGTYSGGLMIGHRWWAPLGGREFAEWPYLATRAQQIHIAEKIVDAQGLDRGWQCWP
jgi:hypothetical protein